MHSIWKGGEEAARLAFEILSGEVDPLSTLTAFTLFIAVMVYSARRPTTSRELIVLWTLESSTMVLWTGCLLALHYAGLV